MAGARVLTGFVRATGKDHENFGSDEFLRPTDRAVNEVLRIGDHERALRVAPFRWGGECRLEVHLNAIANDRGVIQVFGFTSFFEGDSEDTPHERDREIVNVLVPKFHHQHLKHPVVTSTHLQSGADSGDITISLQNFPSEEEDE